MNYLGNGSLLCLSDGQNIQYLCTYSSPSFLQIVTSEPLIAHPMGQVCHAQTPETASYTGRVTQIDALLDTCLVRYIETTKPLDISLILPGYCRMYPYPDLKQGEQHLPAYLVRIPTGIPQGYVCTVKEERLLITAVGDYDFLENGRVVRVRPGRCAILFIHDHPSNGAKSVKEYLSLLDSPHFTQSTFYKKAIQSSPHRSCAQNALLALFCKTGGVISGHGELCVYPSDLPIVGQALLQAGHKEKAVQVANYLLSLYRQYGYLPLHATATPPYLVCEQTNMEGAMYPSVGLFFHSLIQSGVEPKLKNELEKTISQLLDHACRHTVEGELEFCPLSFSLRRGDIPPEKIIESSALATAELLHLLTLYPSARGNALRQTALTHIKTDFPTETMSVCDHHRAARFRLPPTLYGPCPTCGDFTYVGWLTRAKFGSYLCPSCHGKGMREWTLTKKNILLPGTYAAYLQNLYKAKGMDYPSLCHNLDACAKAAVEKGDENSLYDLCLLLPPLKEVGSPHLSVLENITERLMKMRFQRPLYAAEAAAFLLANSI